uniref:Uncharacterized protein n=1 Tax=Anguilla anguilla TaxID=7936 RepID=A0A0E9Q8R9_ANGAN
MVVRHLLSKLLAFRDLHRTTDSVFLPTISCIKASNLD